MTSLSVHAFRDRKGKLKLKTKEVPVPSLGEDATLTVRELTVDEIGKWNELNRLREKMPEGGVKAYGTIASHMVGLSLIDPDTGKNFFINRQEIVEGMKGLPNRDVQDLWDACAELNKLTRDAVEDVKGNSESTPESDSGTT